MKIISYSGYSDCDQTFLDEYSKWNGPVNDLRLLKKSKADYFCFYRGFWCQDNKIQLCVEPKFAKNSDSQPKKIRMRNIQIFLHAWSVTETF